MGIFPMKLEGREGGSGLEDSGTGIFIQRLTPSTLEMGNRAGVCSMESWVAVQVAGQTGFSLLVEPPPWEALWAKTDRLPQ